MRLGLLVIVLLTLLAAPAQAKVVFETYRAPTVGGAEIAIEVMRDDAHANAPVVLTYSPYNTLGETRSGNLANDALGQRLVKKGYARAVADVLGTRNSSGCWDYGGPKETQSGVDVVKYLASRPWSNGRVGMIGTSYDGTTANMVASRGADVPELKAIVPIAAISRWYGYAYGDGVRYALNSEVPTDEGLDTPFAFDFGFARTPPTDADDPKFAAKLASRVDPCQSVEHTLKGYDTSPDYDGFWAERDYRRHAARFRAAVLVAHGWQDYNVKQEEGLALFEALPEDGPLKRMYVWQDAHASPSGDRWTGLLDAFLDQHLLGRDTDIESRPQVTTESRSVSDDGSYESAGFREEDAWPPLGTRTEHLWLKRTFDQDVPGVTLPHPSTGETGVLDAQPNTEEKDNVFTWVGAPVTEELANRDPLNEPGKGHGYYSLSFATTPLTAPVRIAGRPVLDAWVRSPSGGHLAPVLVDIAPDGTTTTIARGFLNIDYRDGLETAKPAGMKWSRAKVRFLPQDVIVRPGHRIGVHVQSANTVWAIPGRPDQNNILTGPLKDVSSEGSSLLLPVAPVTPIRGPGAPAPTGPGVHAATPSPAAQSFAPGRAAASRKTSVRKKRVSRAAKLRACRKKAAKTKSKAKRRAALRRCDKRYAPKKKPKRAAKKRR
jgi:X-Pro dipeptidyl-peptidase